MHWLLLPIVIKIINLKNVIFLKSIFKNVKEQETKRFFFFFKQRIVPCQPISSSNILPYESRTLTETMNESCISYTLFVSELTVHLLACITTI